MIAIDDYIPSMKWNSWGIQPMCASMPDSKVLVPLIEKAFAKMCLCLNTIHRQKLYRLVNTALHTRLKSFSTVVWVAQHWALGCCVKKVVADATFSVCSGSGAISSSGHGIHAVVARQPQ